MSGVWASRKRKRRFGCRRLRFRLGRVLSGSSKRRMEMLMRHGFLSLLLLLCGLSLSAWAEDPPVVPLWEKGAPGVEDRKDEKENRDVQKSGENRVTKI